MKDQTHYADDTTMDYIADLEKTVHEQAAQVNVAREALSLIAMPVRSDGTYNRCREACERLAKEALSKLEPSK